MLKYLNNIALIGKTLRNKLLFDIYTKDVDYYEFFKNMNSKNIETKNLISNFLKRKIPSPVKTSN